MTDRWVILVGDLESGYEARGPYGSDEIQSAWDSLVAQDLPAVAMPLHPVAAVEPPVVVTESYREPAPVEGPTRAELLARRREQAELAERRGAEDESDLDRAFHGVRPSGGISPEARMRRMGL